jgi:hypothetical protein
MNFVSVAGNRSLCKTRGAAPSNPLDAAQISAEVEARQSLEALA